MTPNLTPEQIEAMVAKLKADPAGALECEFPDKPRDDGTVEYCWHNSRGRARLLFLNIAAVGNKRLPFKPDFAASLLSLYKLDAPMPPGAELDAWAEKWHLEVRGDDARVVPAPWAIEWARMVLRAHDDREQDRRYSAATAQAPIFTRAAIKDRDGQTIHGTVGMCFTPASLDPEDYEWIRNVTPMTVRAFTSPSPKPWQPDVESRTQYRNYICGYKYRGKDGKPVYVPGYLDQMKAEALKAGMVEDPRPLRQRESKHYDWLVRWQIWRDDLPTISRAAGESEGAVWEGIKDLARDIELKPRKQPRKQSRR